MDVDLPDARNINDAKNTPNQSTQNQIKPFWDGRWNKEFKLDNLGQVMPGSLSIVSGLVKLVLTSTQEVN